MQNAGLIKRYGAGLYELLSLVAIWLLCTFIFEMLVHHLPVELKRPLLQLILWSVTGLYFIVCWLRTGQTLATQAWKIKLVDADGQLLRPQQALYRYVLASLSLMLFGLGFLWALIDRERLFLHDRLLNTRLILQAEKA